MMKSTIKSALFATAALALLATPAAAQGPDAAKLSELTRIIEQQQKMIEAQASTLEALKTQVEALQTTTQANKAAVTATTEKVAKTTEQVQQVVRQVEQADTPPKMVTSGSDTVKLAVSGQVNRAVMLAGDGEQTDLFHVDNDHSSTRVRFVGTGKPTEDITVGAQVEVQFESNSSGNVDQNNENNEVTTNSFTERKLELYFDHKTFGRLWLGQGETASDGTSHVDLSGTDLIAYAAIHDLAGSLLFRNSTTNALTAIEIADAYDDIDGLSRDDRIRYDSPKFQGFQLSLGHVQGGENDYALRYSGQWGDFKTAAAVAWANIASTSTSTDYQSNGSGSVLHDPTGFSLTLAGGQAKAKAAGRANPTFFYSKVGWQKKLFEVGNSYFSIDYAFSNDRAQNDDEFQTIGVGAVQKLDAWGTELYAGFRNHQMNRTAVQLDDINVGMVGARVKF